MRNLVFSSLLALSCWLAPAAHAQDWRPLLNGKNLDGWQARGEGIWTVMPDGSLLGQRSHDKPSDPFGKPWPIDSKEFDSWLYRQAWLYTSASYGQFDLHVEYFLPAHTNSGISIRDVSRAHYAIGEAGKADPPLTTALKGTPAHIGYEIQLIDGDSDKYPTGSVYTFVAARKGVQKRDEWNSMDIESRTNMIRVKVNGVVVAEYAGDPARSKTGPIGLQLHDQFTFVMFRNIKIREIK
ncbi:DUF1080 domain-containing protein [uncultured Paludibaculum sp.]|uniref:3-keto-disaccharide hydrolase n=1 Tax=uncultured Paludibaculum sp. TaxID=1765020 RepID=UPI002AAA9EA7|nr:DUF1080 domain-containing protein [uncultured Paludibaculum sp.]